MKIDFIGIGAGKCASTWIFQCLLEHSEISGPAQKELKFFDSVHQLNKGKDYYLSLFPTDKPDARNGEFSPGYLPSRDAADRIKQWFPEVKLLVTLRNPIDKMYSTYWSNKIGGRGSLAVFETFEDAFHHVPEMIENAKYGKQLEYYFSLFPREQFHIMFYDDVVADPAGVIKNVYEFLGVDTSFVAPSLDRGVNETGAKKIKYPRLMKFIYGTYWKLKRTIFWRYVQQIIDTRKIALILMRFGVGKGGEKIKKPEMNPETRKYLQQKFHEDLELLGKLLHKDFSHYK
jgi:hypothetical protein